MAGNDTVSAKDLAKAFRMKGWRQMICFPHYNEEDYYAHKTGEQPKIVHTKAGTSFATWVYDPDRDAIEIVNLVYKPYKIKIFLNLYNYGDNDKIKVIFAE